jgi:hypothetical protein
MTLSVLAGCGEPRAPVAPVASETAATLPPTATAMETVAPSATPPPVASVAPPPTASSATTWETCPPGWSSNEVHKARGYAALPFADVPAKLPKDGHFDTEATVAAASKCPPCPPKAECKPCPEPYVDLKDGAAAPLHVVVPSNVTDLVVGKRYKVSIAACAGSTPPTYQLRGYEPVK